VKELLKSDSICESYAQMKKGPVFFDSQCTCSSSTCLVICISLVLRKTNNTNRLKYRPKQYATNNFGSYVRFWL